MGVSPLVPGRVSVERAVRALRAVRVAVPASRSYRRRGLAL